MHMPKSTIAQVSRLHKTIFHRQNRIFPTGKRSSCPPEILSLGPPASGTSIFRTFVMSDLEKCFSRPKVRFSKSAESPESSSADRVFAKPKIKSVSSVRPPIKILKAPMANDEFEGSSSPDGICSRRSAGDCPSNEGLRPSAPSGRPCSKEPSPEGHRSNVRLPAAEEKPPKTLGAPEQPTGGSRRILVEKRASSARNVRAVLAKESKKSSASLPDKISKRSEPARPIKGASVGAKTTAAGKENIPSRASSENVPRVPDNTPGTTSESATKSGTSRSRSTLGEKSSGAVGRPSEAAARASVRVQKSTKPSAKVGTAKKTGESSRATSRERRRDVATKRPVVGLMACAKSVGTGHKKTPMRKTVLRDTAATVSAVYVGPGLPRSRSPDFLARSRTDRAPRSRSEILSGDKLDRPEYNSIACTIRQLRDARAEQIVEDVEHLPAIYRRLVNGKVSSALDFGANEAIYRDLVDLSIDEKQLPARLTRSKDPEPRQRDITPKLSDFFVPTNDEEYRRAVLTRPPSPRVFDTWNPYKISDRIFSWKDSLDRDL